LPAALTGISTFAHMVNVDFFKDLLQVLKDLISMEESVPEAGDVESPTSIRMLELISCRLMCIITAFELLSGQGSLF
jgi:nucleolar complex protein 3